MTAKLDVLTVRRPALGWGLRTAISDAVDVLVLIWGLPVAVLVIGTPIALAIMLVLWLGGMARGAF